MAARIMGFEIGRSGQWYEMYLGTDMSVQAQSIANQVLAKFHDNDDVYQSLVDHIEWTSAKVADEVDWVSTSLIYLPHPETGDMAGICLLRARPSVSRVDFRRELDNWPRDWSDVDFIRITPVSTELAPGHVEGVLALLGAPSESEEGVGRLVYERLALAVFPPHCDDMIEVMCIASHLGAFPDLLRQIMEMLATLNIELAELAVAA